MYLVFAIIAGIDVVQIMRDDLQTILHEAARDVADIRLGTTITAIEKHGEESAVTFSDGESAMFDVVIGADGLYSKVRDLVMPDAPKPSYTGQGCWRAQTEPPPHWTTAKMFLGPVKVGFTPYAKDRMYMFLLENAKDKPFYKNEELLPRLKALLAPFGGELAEIRDAMDEATPILARPLESVLIDGPWHVGRVLLIGDAAHSAQFSIGSGTKIAMEWDGFDAWGRRLQGAPD